MDSNALFALLAAGIFSNNFAFECFLGVTPLLGCKKQPAKAAALGACVGVVMVVSAAVCRPINELVLDKLGLGYLSSFVMPLVVLAVAYLCELVCKAVFKKSLGVYFPVIALNSAVLGLVVGADVQGTYLETIISSLGIALGFTLGLVLMSGLRDKLEDEAVPGAFKGLPVKLLAACIISMTMMAIK